MPYARAEAILILENKSIELTIRPLYNQQRKCWTRHIHTILPHLKDLEHKPHQHRADRVVARTWELADAYDNAVSRFARALELRDKETEGHSRRVTENTMKIAQKMGISGEALEDIRSGSFCMISER